MVPYLVSIFSRSQIYLERESEVRLDNFNNVVTISCSPSLRKDSLTFTKPKSKAPGKVNMNVLLIRLTLAFAITLQIADATRERTLRGNRGLNEKQDRFTLENGHCEICSKDNKAFPESLTFQFSFPAADSLYQSSSFLSCKASTVVDTTSLKIMTTTGDFQEFESLQEGTIFTVKGPFHKESFFLWGV